MYVCASTSVRLPQGACGGQRKALKSHSSPVTLWDLKIELGFSSLRGSSSSS